jgi:large subunit ribosomal protein L10
MDRAQKQVQIDFVKERMARMTSLVVVDYARMSVETATKLRVEFRKAGVEYRVVKNTLVRQALKGAAGFDSLAKTFRGMSGIAWSYEDPSAAAKVVKKFRKDNEGKLTIRLGFIDGQLLDEKGVEDQLATMPGKDELRATLLATMQAPLQNFLALINAPAQNFAYLLDAKHRAMGGEAAGDAPST